MSSGQAGGLPELTIVAGQPTAQETAALVVVLSALASEPGPAPATRPAWSEWAARSRFPRPPLTPGPGAWRASALPR